MLAEGVRIPVTAFHEVFCRMFPIWDLQTFSTDEMFTIFGNPDEDWSFESEFRCISLRHYPLRLFNDNMQAPKWTSRRVYERGFWSIVHKGPPGLLVHGEMDVIIPSNAIMSPTFAAGGATAAARSAGISAGPDGAGAGSANLEGLLRTMQATTTWKLIVG